MLYKISLFIHVAGALLFFGALAVEWICLVNFPKAGKTESPNSLLNTFAGSLKMGSIALLIILIPGIYMMVEVWKNAGWINIAFLGLFAIGAIGGIVSQKKIKTVIKTIAAGNVLSDAQKKGLTDSSLWFSLKMRTTLFTGVIFLMTYKTEMTDSLIVMAIAIVLGLLPWKIGTPAESRMKVEKKLE